MSLITKIYKHGDFFLLTWQKLNVQVSVGHVDSSLAYRSHVVTLPFGRNCAVRSPGSRSLKVVLIFLPMWQLYNLLSVLGKLKLHGHYYGVVD